MKFGTYIDEPLNFKYITIPKEKSVECIESPIESTG